MDHDSIKKRLFENPWDDSPELEQALSQDPEAEALRAELQALDSELEVSPPPGLRRQLMTIPDQHPVNTGSWLDRLAFWRRRSWHAVLPTAASLLFAISLGLYYWPLDADGMRRDILEHMYTELQMMATDREIDISMVNEHMGTLGAHLETNASTRDLDVMDMKDCRIAHEHCLHFVVRTPEGPVAVIVIDNDPIEGEYPIKDGRFSGVITPVGQGNLAILTDAEHQESVSRVKQVLASNITW